MPALQEGSGLHAPQDAYIGFSMHPNAPSNSSSQAAYKKHEDENKRGDIDQGVFSPLIFPNCMGQLQDATTF